MRGVTGRVSEVAALMAEGLTNREIATRLGVSEQTVKAHVQFLFTYFRVRNRVEFANAWREYQAQE